MTKYLNGGKLFTKSPLLHFLGVEQTFCKRYQKVQNNEQVYMNLCTIKQSFDERIYKELL
jgi:hypothetical protein